MDVPGILCRVLIIGLLVASYFNRKVIYITIIDIILLKLLEPDEPDEPEEDDDLDLPNNVIVLRIELVIWFSIIFCWFVFMLYWVVVNFNAIHF